MTKLKIWNEHKTWEEAEKEWDQGAESFSRVQPIKTLTKLPSMRGITDDTARHLKWKSLKWMVLNDHEKRILKHFFKHPFKYGWALLKSLRKRESYVREGDFFLYGMKHLNEFDKLLKSRNTLLVVGFSYCHKPFECPSGRFNDNCIHDADNPICRQCFIGKAVNSLPEKETIPLFIPTIHYIGDKIFELVHKNPTKQIIFIITACELTLKMFGDWGNMVNIKGIGVRLDGRICNTMKAFELSEQGIKPGLTVVLEETQKKILNLIKIRNRG